MNVCQWYLNNIFLSYYLDKNTREIILQDRVRECYYEIHIIGFFFKYHESDIHFTGMTFCFLFYYITMNKKKNSTA